MVHQGCYTMLAMMISLDDSPGGNTHAGVVGVATPPPSAAL